MEVKDGWKMKGWKESIREGWVRKNAEGRREIKEEGWLYCKAYSQLERGWSRCQTPSVGTGYYYVLISKMPNPAFFHLPLRES